MGLGELHSRPGLRRGMFFVRDDAGGGLRPGVSRFGQQPRHSDQIVGGHCEGELERHAPGAAQLRLAETGDGLRPAEGLLDPLANTLRDGMAGMPRGPAIDAAAPALAGLGRGIVARDVRRHAHAAQRADEARRVVALVGAEREAPRRSRRLPVEHQDCRLALRRSTRLSEMRLNHQPWRFSLTSVRAP